MGNVTYIMSQPPSQVIDDYKNKNFEGFVSQINQIDKNQKLLHTAQEDLINLNTQCLPFHQPQTAPKSASQIQELININTNLTNLYKETTQKLIDSPDISVQDVISYLSKMKSALHAELEKFTSSESLRNAIHYGQAFRTLDAYLKGLETFQEQQMIQRLAVQFYNAIQIHASIMKSIKTIVEKPSDKNNLAEPEQDKSLLSDFLNIATHAKKQCQHIIEELKSEEPNRFFEATNKAWKDYFVLKTQEADGTNDTVKEEELDKDGVIQKLREKIRGYEITTSVISQAFGIPLPTETDPAAANQLI